MDVKENETLQIGVSRPPLRVDDLPSPEEVFGRQRIGVREMISCILGPSMIALGVSIGSGEWLLGPLAFGKYGFAGLGWLITLSAVLQIYYNIENGRYTIATGEVPIVGFTRTPPGFRFWSLLTLAIIYLGWIWGGWASAAGQSLFALVRGRSFDPQSLVELESVRLIAIGLMFLSLIIYMFGKKIARTMELIDTVLVALTLGIISVLALLFVPGALWREMLWSTVTPGALPRGIDAITLGSIIGYTGFGAGMNFMLINYYRDHGYGMGHRVGYYSGLVGGQKQEILPTGVTFRDSEKNRQLWKRWFRYLKIDQWGIFFSGAMIGMFVPSVLIVALTRLPGAGTPSTANMPVYAAQELGRQAGILLPLILLLGAVILFKTQTTVLEMLIRNSSDVAIAVSPRLRRLIRGDPRHAYYGIALMFITMIGVIIHLALPTDLLRISANMANLASMIYPLVLLYLNRQLPRPARSGWGAVLAMVLNVLFFGFFFVNYMTAMLTGAPLVNF